MLALYLKEIRSFLSSIIGYVVITVFLVLNSLFIWIFPGEFNILSSGYAALDPFFFIAPWVFLFLIPAITMRLFAEEKRTGTIELLLTKPITDLQLVLAKYLAGLTLVLIALIPTILYYVCIYLLGQPVGNIDAGGTFGSYLGLLFLGSGFVSIGVFASSITQNQITAFILAVFLCFIIYTGFDAVGALLASTGFDSLVINLGMNEHFISLSRGVIDTRDVVYFIALSAVFVLFTQTVIKSKKW